MPLHSHVVPTDTGTAQQGSGAHGLSPCRALHQAAAHLGGRRGLGSRRDLGGRSGRHGRRHHRAAVGVEAEHALVHLAPRRLGRSAEAEELRAQPGVTVSQPVAWNAYPGDTSGCFWSRCAIGRNSNASLISACPAGRCQPRKLAVETSAGLCLAVAQSPPYIAADAAQQRSSGRRSSAEC